MVFPNRDSFSCQLRANRKWNVSEVETVCLETRAEILIINVGEGDVWKCHLSEETGKPSFSASKMFDSFFFTWDMGHHIQALCVAGKPFHTFVR